MNGTRSLTGIRSLFRGERIRLCVIAASALLALMGCKAPQVDDPRAGIAPQEPDIHAPAPQPSALDERCFVVGTSIDDRPIACISLGKGDDVILFIASIHGDEKAGTPLLHDLATWFRDRPQLLEGRRILLLPESNPDGMAAERRSNSRGIDLNRNFPSRNRTNNRLYGFAPLSEPESAVIAKLIRIHAPSRIVTLHEPVACIDYDGPALLLAAHMSMHCPLPVRKLGTRPGSLGAWAGEDLGIAIVTLELPRDARDQDPEKLWNLYGKTLIEAVLFRPPSRGIDFERPAL